MIRCAIAGLGRIGSTLEDDTKREKPASHAGAISEHPQCTIVAGCDRESEKCNDFSQRWNCKRTYVDFGDMLTENDIDILHIATPPETHKHFLTAAIAHNIPVIICEKPVADNLDDAIAMRKAAESSNSRVIINHERRYSLDYRHTRKLIRYGTYGSLLSITARVYMGKHRPVNKVLLEDGTHMLDCLYFLADRDIELTYVDGNFHSKNASVFAFMDAEGVPIILEVGSSRDHILFELDCSFERGRVRVGNGLYEEYESKPSPFYDDMLSLLPIDVSFTKTEYFRRMFAEAVELFKGNIDTVTSSLDDGIKVMKLIDEISKGF